MPSSPPASTHGGLTSALKQVYYIHKGIVADLTAKNQVLAEENRKVKKLLKDSTARHDQCVSCTKLHQINQSLQRQLDALLEKQDSKSYSLDVPSCTRDDERTDTAVEAHLDHTRVATAATVDKSELPLSRKRCGPHENTHQSKKQKTSTSPEDRSGKKCIDKHAETTVEPTRSAVILVKETEVIPPESRPGSGEVASPRMLAVPETLNVDTCFNTSIIIDDDEEGTDTDNDCRSTVNDSSYTASDQYNADNTVFSSKMVEVDKDTTCSGLDNVDECDLRKESSSSKGNVQKQTGWIKSGSAPRRMRKNLLRQSTLSQTFYRQPRQSGEDIQLAEAISRSLDDMHTGSNRKHANMSKPEPSFKVPKSPDGCSLVKHSLNASLHGGVARELRKSDEKSKRQITNVENIEAPALNSSELNLSLDPGLKFSEFLLDSDRVAGQHSSLGGLDNTMDHAQHSTAESLDKIRHCSPKRGLDETMAPNNLDESGLGNQTMVSPHLLARQPVGRDCSSKGQGSCVTQLSRSAPDAGVDKHKTCHKNLSLKLRKTTTNSEKLATESPRLTNVKPPSSDTVQENSQHLDDTSLGVDETSRLGAIERELFGEEDSDYDETIAPSPQQTMNDSSFPCTSRSFKFGMRKSNSSITTRTSPVDKLAGRHHLEELSLPNTSLDLLDVGSQDLRLEEEDGSPAAGQDQYLPGLDDQELEEDCEQENKHYVPSVDKLQDSFDRVPRVLSPVVAHVEVVRKRSERDKLEGFSCKQCFEYYKHSGLSEEELKKKMKICSRHKHRYKAPDTPEHFWTLGFPDTAEMLDRQTSNEADSPVAARRRQKRNC